MRSLKGQYNTVLTARDALAAAEAKVIVETNNLNKAAASRAVGQMTELQYQTAENAQLAAQNDVKTKKLQLLLAMEAYDWNVKGLTTSN